MRSRRAHLRVIPPPVSLRATLMLALDAESPPRGSAEQFGLELLLDLSRVLRFAGSGDTVRLRLVGDGEPLTLESALSRHWHIDRADGVVTLPRSVLRLVTSIAGATREQRATTFDRFGRVRPEDNDLVASGHERSPVLSLAAVALRRAVIDVAGRRPVRFLAPWPNDRRWAVAMSHDLDVVARWPVFTGLRLIELARKGDLSRVRQVVGAAFWSAARDPVWDGIQGILEAERTNAVRSTWFILCGTPTFRTMRAGDLTYVPESAPARRIITAVVSAGLGVELHGSFDTYVDEHHFREQRLRLGTISGTVPNGVRQHYLRMRPGLTHLAMAAAGFRHDSTFGFADRNGFRLGVADVLPVWSDANQSQLNIDEVPFTWMDRALSKYRGIESPSAWIADALELAATTRTVDGLWCGIWHPNLTPALGFPDAPAAYGHLLRELASMQPFFGTTQQIVAWRRARRSARATAVAADGATVYHATEPSPEYPLALEDADGARLADPPSASV
ncbi:MAG TPA: hypothetical protein VFD67_09220 [Gemmatimonadaceae bacterium]|nr:hypothetical protein [Gemmatimonadaceae bacterium]